MPQRDLESKLRIEFLETITLTGTGDVDGTRSADLQNVRGVTFMINPQADITGQDVLLQAIESSDDSVFTEVAADKILPAGETLDGNTAAGLPRQDYGVFSTERYVRPRFNITSITGSVDVDVFAIYCDELLPDPAPATDGLP